MTNVVEFLRKKTINDLFKTDSFEKAWSTWEPIIRKQSDDLKPAKIIDLGDKLRNIMSSTNPNSNATSSTSMDLSEMQSLKTISGHLWEALVTWYCNLCLIGTRTVIIKKASFIPENLQKVIEIDYDGDKSLAEADLWAITFPDEKEFTDEIPESFINLSKPTKREPEGKTEKINQNNAKISSGMLGWLNQNIGKYFSGFELGIISCKTPWNDFAVIPEHWDLVYALSKEMPEALEIKKITIGKDSTFSIVGLKKFFYAFATLPSQEPSKFSNPKTLPIIRLKQLTGGNYWGLPTQPGVNSVKDIFTKNFSSSIGSKSDHQTHLQSELSKLNTDYNYFKL